MESRWASLGYIGSIILVFYGFFFFIAYNLSPIVLSSFGGSIVSILLGVMALFGGMLFSCAFLAFGNELKVSWSWVPFVIGVIVWIIQGVAQILVSLNHPTGITLYGWMVIVIVLLFIVWGAFLFTMRKLLGRKQRLGLYASILFLLNALGWLSVLGMGLLVCNMLLMAIILIPDKRLLPIPSLGEFFNTKRKSSLSKLGTFLLFVYAVLAIKWLINGLFPLPVLAAASLNFFSLLTIWVAIPGLVLLFLDFEQRYNNPLSYYSIVVGVPALLLLSITDFTWLMSNINVFADPSWGLQQYSTLSLLWSWTGIPLFLWSMLTAIAFLQIYRLPQIQGNIIFLIIHLMFLFSGLLWLFGLGYIFLIFAGLLLYWKYWVKP
ncbi:MAG: hypothetical protein ACFFD8_04755 [Candidatus Thorarchaeota archaeon]